MYSWGLGRVRGRALVSVVPAAQFPGIASSVSWSGLRPTCCLAGSGHLSLRRKRGCRAPFPGELSVAVHHGLCSSRAQGDLQASTPVFIRLISFGLLRGKAAGIGLEREVRRACLPEAVWAVTWSVE